MRPPQQYFIIIGAPKCGSTTLATVLRQRPDMRFTQYKEPRFFTDFAERDWHGPGLGRFNKTMMRDEAAYLGGFGDCGADTWGLDASTDYSWAPSAPERILAWRERFRVKLAIILRDPFDRIVSEYQHTLREGLQSDPILRSLDREEERIAAGWHPLFYHLRRSRYDRAVDTYHGLFGDDLLILRYEELKDLPALIARVERFLGVAPHPLGEASGTRKNESYVFRSRKFDSFRRHPLVRRAVRSVLPSGLRQMAWEHYAATMKTKLALSRRESEALSERIAPIVAACEAHPLIDTTGWREPARSTAA